MVDDNQKGFTSMHASLRISFVLGMSEPSDSRAPYSLESPGTQLDVVQVMPEGGRARNHQGSMAADCGPPAARSCVP